MGAGAFIGGALKGYGSTMLRLQERDFEREMTRRKARVELLTQAIPHITDPSLRAEAINLAEEFAAGKTKKQRGGLAQMLGGLLGRQAEDVGHEEKFGEFMQRPREVEARPPATGTMTLPSIPGLPEEQRRVSIPGVQEQVRGPFATPAETARLAGAGRAATVTAEQEARAPFDWAKPEIVQRADGSYVYRQWNMTTGEYRDKPVPPGEFPAGTPGAIAQAVKELKQQFPGITDEEALTYVTGHRGYAGRTIRGIEGTPYGFPGQSVTLQVDETGAVTGALPEAPYGARGAPIYKQIAEPGTGRPVWARIDPTTNRPTAIVAEVPSPNDYRMFTDVQGNTWAVPVPRYGPTGAGGATPTLPPIPGGGAAGAPGPAAGPQPPAPGAVPLGHKPLTGAAKKEIGMVKQAMRFAQELRQLLETPGPDGIPLSQRTSLDKQTRDWLKARAEGLLYNMGIKSSDPVFSRANPLSSLLRVLITGPYLRGLRNQLWVNQIQQHMPDAARHTPAAMMSRMDVTFAALEGMKRDIMEQEGLTEETWGGLGAGAAPAPPAPAKPKPEIPPEPKW